MILKRGANNEIDAVKSVQKALGVPIDGDFGQGTEAAVMQFQTTHGLKVDGIVGNETAVKMGVDLNEYLDTDLSAKVMTTSTGLVIKKSYLNGDQYLAGPTDKYYLFLHHTAGWENPYNVIKDWNTDDRGKIGVQFVIGGKSIKNGDATHDGEVVECFTDEAYAYHLGKNGSELLHPHSIGIEVCNFGQLTKKGDKYYNYVNIEVPVNQVCDLGYEFRGFRYYHAYSDKQIEALKNLIKEIQRRHPKIDITKGIKEWLKSQTPANAFDYKDDAFYGKIKGMLVHCSTRKDKNDMYPSPNLIKMLKSL